MKMNLRFLCLVLILVTISIVSAHSGHHNHDHNHHHDHHQEQVQIKNDTLKNVPPVGEASPVSHEYLKAFRDFSTSLMKQSIYYNSLHNTGAVCYCPFTLGYLLAVIQGDSRVIDVPVQDFRNLLNLREKENVTEAYSEMVHSFIEDVKVSATSTYYTEGNIIPDVEAYKELHNVQVSIPLNGNSIPASQIINQEIQKHTKDAIINRVVPMDPNLNEATMGVLANTFYYKAGWESAFTSVGMKPFTVEPGSGNVKDISSMRTVAKFRTLDTEKYISVSVPLLGGRKRIVFVQPKTSLKDYIQTTVGEIFESCPRSWSKRQVTLQVPVMNLVLGRDYLEQLDQLAGVQTQCTMNQTDFRNFLQPIVQVVSCKITPDGYELAVSNGVQVNKVSPPIAPPSQRSDMTMMMNSAEETMTTMEQRQTPMTFRQITKSDSEQVEEPETAEVPELPPIDLTFDKPFFIYWHDNNLGPVSFAAVESLFDTASIPSTPTNARVHMENPSARHHIPGHIGDGPGDNDNFSEKSKTERWSCHSSHSHMH